MKKKIDYQKIFDVLGQDSCPICMVVEKNVERFLESLLYENVTDVTLRTELKKSNGLCHTHSWKMRSKGDPLAHAFIYGGLLKSMSSGIKAYLEEPQTKKRLFSPKSESARVKKLHEKLHPPRGCIVCKLVKENEAQYLNSFAEFISNDTAFAQKFKEDGFLCLNHTRKLLDECGDTPAVSTILELQLEKINNLMGHLDEITRKSDYRFTDEQWTEDEKTAWVKAVRLWSGEQN